MKTTVELLDAVRAKQELTSDYQLARLLGVSTQRMSNWRTGRNTMDNAAAVRVADLLLRPAMEIVAIVEAERARTDGLRKFWRDVAASVAAVGVVALFAPDQLAALLPVSLDAADYAALYIMSSLAALLAALAILGAAPASPRYLGDGSACPRCQPANSGEFGWLHPSAERPGQLVCNGCGSYFAPGLQPALAVGIFLTRFVSNAGQTAPRAPR